MEQLIEDLQPQFDVGVPEQAIYATITGDATEIAKARSALTQLKKRGDIYEPQSGYIRTI